MSKKKETQTQTQDNTIDPYSQARIDTATNNVRDIFSQPFESYQGDRVAGLSDAEQQARTQFSQTQGQGLGLFNDAANIAQNVGGYQPQQIGAQTFADADISSYINPYTSQVVDTTNKELRRQGDIAQAGVNAGATRAGAFGGSRHGVQAAEQERATQDILARTTAGLNQDAFNQAASLFNQDANRQFQADSANANLGIQGQNLSLQGAGLLGSLGGQINDANRLNALTLDQFGQSQRGIEQAGLDADYQEELRRYEDQLNRANIELGLLSGTPVITDSSGSSTATQSNGIGGIIKTGGTVAGLLSDKRLKTNIQPIGEKNGRKWYRYRYVWDNPLVRRIGVMAQDLLVNEPERVGVHKSGFFLVNYEGMEA